MALQTLQTPGIREQMPRHSKQARATAEHTHAQTKNAQAVLTEAHGGTHEQHHRNTQLIWALLREFNLLAGHQRPEYQLIRYNNPPVSASHERLSNNLPPWAQNTFPTCANEVLPPRHGYPSISALIAIYNKMKTMLISHKCASLLINRPRG